MSKEETKTDLARRNLIIMIAAFAAVYIIWGSTYLAIKYAIETIPSFLMAGVRFLVAGGILYTFARVTGNYEKPKLVHWRTSFIVGTLLLGIGNGGVVIAEHYISSSLTALLIATMPFWMVLLGWMFMGSGKPNYKVALGLFIGFAGVALLITGRSVETSDGSGDGWLFGLVCILVAEIGWAFGSLYGAKAPTAKSFVQAAGMQMLAGGLVLVVAGMATGEWAALNVAAISTNSWLALLYLIFFGAIIAYTAYSWLLKNVSPAAVSTYAYVNPAIAVCLGWAIAGESLTGQMLIGAVVIVASVALITLQKSGKKTVIEDEISDANLGVAKTRATYST
ncbi:MAG: EamA family transporter [Pyrinomonadaceae bacterium]